MCHNHNNLFIYMIGGRYTPLGNRTPRGSKKGASTGYISLLMIEEDVDPRKFQRIFSIIFGFYNLHSFVWK